MTQQNLYELFAIMQAHLNEPEHINPDVLVRLINSIRPTHAHDSVETHDKLKQLIDFLNSQPQHADILHDYILSTLSGYRQSTLYADGGILGHDGFFTQLGQRLGAKFLPPLRDHTQLSDLFQQLFHHKHDAIWLANISSEDSQTLFGLLMQSNGDPLLRKQAIEQILHAMMVISYRITTIGLDPEFVRAYPELYEYESPFLVQNRDTLDFIQKYREFTSEDNTRWSPVIPDEKPALVMLDQCRDVLNRIKRGTRRHGVSLSLTNVLIRLEQCLNRIELLFQLLLDDPQQVQQSLVKLLGTLTAAQQEQHSIRSLISINTELVSRQVTENASRTGGHYVSTDKQGFANMYRSAAGAGSIIAVMATLKILAGRLVLAPMSQAFLYSMNYSLGFVLIHILHFTVATKQPAMTAAALAATIQQNTGNRATQMAELVELTVNIMRTQFIAILGNISVAMPVGLLIAWLWQQWLHQPLLSAQKADAVLHSLNPLTSLAIPHAAIAGVCLFLSGLIAGYYDNLAVYHHIGPRLRQQPRLQKWLGTARLDRIAVYIENNLGALAGNFWFGIMLGSMGTLGFILGLPLDIRHIAFASANFTQGLFCLHGNYDIGLVLISFLGVLLIGMTNLMVSFGLTLFVALRARRVTYSQWKPLIRLLVTHFITRPSDFFWPPRQPSNIDHHE